MNDLDWVGEIQKNDEEDKVRAILNSIYSQINGLQDLATVQEYAPLMHDMGLVKDTLNDALSLLGEDRNFEKLIRGCIDKMSKEYQNGEYDYMSFEQAAYDAVAIICNKLPDGLKVQATEKAQEIVKKNMEGKEEVYDECDYYEGFYIGSASVAEAIHMDQLFINSLMDVVETAYIERKAEEGIEEDEELDELFGGNKW